MDPCVKSFSSQVCSGCTKQVATSIASGKEGPEDGFHETAVSHLAKLVRGKSLTEEQMEMLVAFDELVLPETWIAPEHSKGPQEQGHWMPHGGK